MKYRYGSDHPEGQDTGAPPEFSMDKPPKQYIADNPTCENADISSALNESFENGESKAKRFVR